MFGRRAASFTVRARTRATPLSRTAWMAGTACALLSTFSFFTAATNARATLTVAELRCENMASPLGVDVEKPRLGWQLRATSRGENQAAYQILAATTAELLARDQGDLWNTGRVESSNTLNIPYAGRPLASSQQVFWKVRVWSTAPTSAQTQALASPWSAAATFTMGVLNTPRDPGWPPGAQWITDPALLKYVRQAAGFASRDASNENVPKWVQLDLGSPQPIDTVIVRGARHGIPERTGLPARFRIDVSNDPAFKNPAAITLVADQTDKDAAPRNSTLAFDMPADRPVTARYLRLTATKLRAPDDGRPYLALGQIEVLSGPAKTNIALRAAVTAGDTHEDTARWSPAALVDGLADSAQNPRANTTLLLRREFTVRPGLVRAFAHITGLGHYEFTVNGARIGNGLLAPGWTHYAKTVLYDTHDITDRLRPGTNALGLVLAGGFHNLQSGPENRYHKLTTPFRPLAAFGQIRLEYADGSVESVPTDAAWRATPGPTTYANLYGGEDHDARLVPAGWDEPGFDDDAWTPATVIPPPGPATTLRGAAHASPPFAHFETLQPVSIKQLREDAAVHDFGQNASMMVRLRARGPAGSIVRMTPAELVKDDGAVDRSSCGGGQAYWQYTLRGDPEGETWTPKFFYHGSRYVQVELFPPAGVTQTAKSADATQSRPIQNPVPSEARSLASKIQNSNTSLPVVEKLESLVTHSDSPPAGDFACSSDLLNRIRALVRWAQRSNLAHVITDCPHREKLGWLEQYHLNGPALRYEWNLDRLFAKTFNDMADAQTDTGLIPDIAPEYVVFGGGFRDSPEWGAAFILAAWQHYIWTADDKPLRAHFAAMNDYLEYLAAMSDKRILSHGLGDWYDIGPGKPGVAQLTPVALTATAIYYEAVQTLSKIAAVIDRPDDEARLAKEAQKISEAFNKAFLNNEDRPGKKSKSEKSGKAAKSATPAAPPVPAGSAEFPLGGRREAPPENAKKNLGAPRDPATAHGAAAPTVNREPGTVNRGGSAAATYATGSQPAQAMPLVIGLVPPGRRAAVLDALVERIQADGGTVTAGDVGYRYLQRALAAAGRSDIIFSMINRADKPGYAWQLAQGATSLTEAWNARRNSSQNHFMLGQITEWFYHDLAGLQPDPEDPGFKKIIIKPQIVGDITWARAMHNSPRGLAGVAWRREGKAAQNGGRLTLEITIPAGATATVFVPTTNPATVMEGGIPAAQSKGVRALGGGAAAGGVAPREAVFAVESGHYIFSAEY